MKYDSRQKKDQFHFGNMMNENEEYDRYGEKNNESSAYRWEKVHKKRIKTNEHFEVSNNGIIALQFTWG